MINIVILNQSKPISLYLKIKNFKNSKYVNGRSLFIKTEIRHVYNPF